MPPILEGFSGGAPFSALPESDVPREPGVYVVVLSERAGRPAFLPASPAGRFTGKDPSVPLSRLEAKWVDGTEVVYIGKAAGGRGGGRGLRKRLDEYRRFGAGPALGRAAGVAARELGRAAGVVEAGRRSGGRGAADARGVPCRARRQAVVREPAGVRGKRGPRVCGFRADIRAGRFMIAGMRRVGPIYVESFVRCSMEDLWAATQDPWRHARWDLRFGRIEYQEKRSDDEPQRFVYATRVAPGVVVAGEGEALGDRERPDGSRWSGLKFWSGDHRSLIASGAGYWRYLPGDGGIRFLTRYDYRTRWGWFGRLVDRLVFRPLFGWATAWSFDRLRLWLEEGIAPERSRDQALAHVLAVAGVAGVWAYQGLVPKLICCTDDEVVLWEGLGLSRQRARLAVRAVGAAEVALGLGAARSRRRPVFLATAAAMLLALAAVAKLSPSALVRAFNPVSLNWAVAALAGIAALTGAGLPSGRTPLRSAPDKQPQVGALP
jgi:hypothetical protein